MSNFTDHTDRQLTKDRIMGYLNALSPCALAAVTRMEIASALNISPATVSRGMRALQDLGCITLTYTPHLDAGPGRWWNIRLTTRTTGSRSLETAKRLVV